ncbi:MAG: hypothetical protein ABSG64_12945 [Solirubrobacteraceae bacterium]
MKSPPELWSELSDPAVLTRLLEQQFGEIRITRVTAETSLGWTSANAHGTVELAASGWGTKVRLSAALHDATPPEQAQAALVGVLDEVGAARHRPFSRA